MTTDSSSQGTNRIYNLISVVMLVLTALVICGVAGFAASGAKIGSGSVAVEPTLFVLGTPTATLVYPTPNSTGTPGPIASTAVTVTGPPSRTPLPSQTSTPTDTPTATNTLTASPSSTASNTPLPSATPTRSAFDFVLKNGVIVYGKYYNVIDRTKKTASASDCGARLAGATFAMNGSYLGGLNIHVTGSGADSTIAAGANPEYGASGWEYYITNTPVVRTYNVQVLYTDGAVASGVVQVTTKSDCNQAVALVNFIQIQSRAP